MKTWFWNSVHGEWQQRQLPANVQITVDNLGLFHYNGGLWCFSEQTPY